MRLTNAKRAALLVAITLTFHFLYTFVVQMQEWASFQRFQWIIIVLFALQLLLASPLLALFWILGTTRINLIASNRGRYLALITACIEVLALATPQLYRLLRVIQQHPGFGWYDTGTVAEQLWRWLKNPWVASQLSQIPQIAEEIALALFLIILFRQMNGAGIIDPHARRLARTLAAVSSSIGGVLFVLDVIRIAYYSVAMIRAGFGSALSAEAGRPAQFISHIATAQVANLCFTATAWIIYRGLSDSYAKELTLEPQLDPLPS
jgi:hypothetical protein